MAAFTDQQLRNIQGFSLGGYRKDQQELMFLRFDTADGARRLLASVAPRVASAWEVGRFNELFSEVRTRTGREALKATWVGCLLSAAAYELLGIPLGDLPPGDGSAAFTAGMAARAPQIGDTRPQDAPTGWAEPFRSQGGVHALLVIASDDPDDLDRTVTELGELASSCQAEVVFQERGATLPAPLTGHEHFGFADGASQPAIDGFDDPPAAGEPPAAPAGEFVLGYPDNTGNTTAVGPMWQDGSLVVFRRLHQNVAAFRAQAAAGVPNANPALTTEQLAARMIGRWPSGAPIELNPDSDPGSGEASNAFAYAAAPFGDDDGQKCPRWAHIRKANPRDETTPDPAADNPVRHRMLRRGIPYGSPLPTDASSDDGIDRGLHFFAVVADIARQFEFVQSQWLNNPNFPSGQPASTGIYGPPAQGSPDGPDPVVGEHDPGIPCTLHQPSGENPFPLLPQIVNVTAGEYFFLPSLTALRAVAHPATS